MGRLTTHVLDTATGQPAAHLNVTLFAISDGNKCRKLVASTTNQDGRCDAPLLEGKLFAPGRYRLDFEVADYFRTRGLDLPDPPFLDVVQIHFGVSEEDANYHVPLLISPYGYSTYRGS